MGPDFAELPIHCDGLDGDPDPVVVLWQLRHYVIEERFVGELPFATEGVAEECF
jgi:hypothetical protein